MRPTIEFMRENFKVFNKEYFNNELRTPKFEVTKTKRIMGQFCYNWGDYIIRLSAYYDRTEFHLKNTLIHEMIHQYIRQKGLKDTRPHHGKVFFSIADRINAAGGWEIKRCSTDNELVSTKTDKTYYLMVMKLVKENKYFLISVQGDKIGYFDNYLSTYRDYFSGVFFFTSTDNKYDRMNVCRRRIRGCYITEEEYNRLKTVHTTFLKEIA